MAPSIPLDVLESAGCRLNGYLADHQIFADWQVHPAGLNFAAELANESGATKVSRIVSWADLAASRYPGELLHNTERRAVAALLPTPSR